MAKGLFEFRQFTIHQEECAMKVGTDGTLLGAWAMAREGQCRILDIGTGTGLMALMMAQRYPEAEITGIDLDEKAVFQAQANAMASPFANRIRIQQADVNSFTDKPFDSIVCNPPFFVDSLTCPDARRSQARHAETLTYETLILSVKRLLDTNGVFSVIIPTDYRSQLLSEASLSGLMLTRECFVRTTPKKSPKRCLMEFRWRPVATVDTATETLEMKPGERSEWYHQLTKEFYLY
ncbi:MAG: methyltransferase [Prevotella sp.]|nr:methyltransferase [Prevotella sp.]